METQEKLTLKELVGYLPWDLKVLSGFGEYSEIDSLYFSKDEHKRPSLNLMVSRFPKGFRGENFIDIKPILRPLSDLTKEITHNGETFVPVEKLGINLFDKETKYFILDGYFNAIPYWVIQKLYEWHFDIHGLIEKGKAIDINTL